MCHRCLPHTVRIVDLHARLKRRLNARPRLVPLATDIPAREKQLIDRLLRGRITAHSRSSDIDQSQSNRDISQRLEPVPSKSCACRFARLPSERLFRPSERRCGSDGWTRYENGFNVKE